MNLDYQETNWTPVNKVSIPDSFYRRIKTHTPFIDEFFSGGLVPGSSFTITGAMGSGKSTMMLTLLDMLGKVNYKVGICSSEEIVSQVAYTCERLNVKHVDIANISNVDHIADALSHYDVVIVDSFQGLTHPRYEGRVRAIEKYAVEKLYTAAKNQETVLGFVCHVTKGGQIKGGTIVTHTVDMNIEFEKPEDFSTLRRVKITKNRFGGCNTLETELTAAGFDFNIEPIIESEAIINPVLTIEAQEITEPENDLTSGINF